MNPLTVAAKASITHVQSRRGQLVYFWIRPEYVVDYRPILDAPVDAAGEVVEEIMLCCC